MPTFETPRFAWPQVTLVLVVGVTATLTVAEIVWEWRVARRIAEIDERAGNWISLVVLELVRLATLPVRVAVFTWFAALSPIALRTTLAVAVACYVATDLLYYVAHRLLHETHLGWALHSVHHTSRTLDLSVAFRLSWIARLGDDFFYLPLVLFGFSPTLVLFAIELNLLSQTWVHTEMIRRLGLMDLCVNTPSNHRVHHHAMEGGPRKNYGGHFMLWDHLFGTYEQEGARREYGTDFGPLGSSLLRVQLEGLRRLWRGTLRLERAPLLDARGASGGGEPGEAHCREHEDAHDVEKRDASALARDALRERHDPGDREPGHHEAEEHQTKGAGSHPADDGRLRSC
jgi:sterol desaturase/sphingolipid hydroxylase (fatty acid hydroxylase superfamily)